MNEHLNISITGTLNDRLKVDLMDSLWYHPDLSKELFNQENPFSIIFREFTLQFLEFNEND